MTRLSPRPDAACETPLASCAAGRIGHSEFPNYTRRERAADRLVHVIGVPAASLAIAGLIASLATHGGNVSQLCAASLYGIGLVGMLAASAAYNLAPFGRAKAILRRVDHAMIFVMIAGSYTPFALCALRPAEGVPLLIAVWVIATAGVMLKAILGNRYSAAFMALYLLHGWAILPVLPAVIAAIPREAMVLLTAGGLVYSLGALVHTRDRWPFHNALWHVMVLVAAGLQMGAIVQVLRIGST